MPESPQASKSKWSEIHKWIRRGFVVWAIVSTTWLANSVRTQGVDPAFLKTSLSVSLQDDGKVLGFLPAVEQSHTGLIFFCGSGIAAEAYAPLLHPIAEAGYRVYVVRLPLRFAPLESHKEEAIDRAKQVIQAHPEIPRWVVAGHSLGAALACRVVQARVPGLAGLVLLGTTHPKKDSLSWCTLPVTKVYASEDRIAPRDKVLGNKNLLPVGTTWIEINGGNHSQFGHYGHQLFDGRPTISRDEQQRIARAAVLNVLGKGEEDVP